jgi:hypothetical protein
MAANGHWLKKKLPWRMLAYRVVFEKGQGALTGWSLLRNHR